MKNAALRAIAVILLAMLVATCVACTGPQGEPGAQGEQGLQGIQGEVGAQGPKGDKGDKGDTGAQGEQGVQGEVGPQGEKGDKGDKGDTGAQGEVGPQGEKGDKGDTGAQGEQGIQGEVGPQGPQGEQGIQGVPGNDGVGITDISLISTDGLTDTYRITYADGKTVDFTVTHGEKGDQGNKGDKGDKGDTGAVGKSAFELYCEKYGFEGTEDEWLAIMNKELFTRYTVTFDYDGGTPSDGAVTELSVPVYSTIELDTPEKEGYIFLGWFVGEDANAAQFTSASIVSRDMTLTAKWAQLSYTVTFVDYYGDTVDVVTVMYGEAASAPAVPSKIKEGSMIFSQWDVDYSCVTQDLTVQAVYVIDQYTVTFNTNGGSEIQNATYYVGAIPDMPENPTKGGYHFLGWYLDEALTVPYAFDSALNENTTLYAYFSESMPIYTAEDLMNIANNPEGDYYLADDIDLNGSSWTPIETFSGTLDGQGHSISCFIITSPNHLYSGLFNMNSGTIRNLTISDFIVTTNNGNGADVVGVLVGENTGIIENCRVVNGEMTIIAALTYKLNQYVHEDCCYGAITGKNFGTIDRCYADVSFGASGEVYDNSKYLRLSIGGIAGENHAVVSNCISECDVDFIGKGHTGSNDADVAGCIGGIVGFNRNGGTVLDCDSTQETSITVSAQRRRNTMNLGLCVGKNDGEIYTSSSQGTIYDAGSATWASVGGFVGENYGVVNDCYALNITIDVASSDQGGTGGFVGYNYKTISRCYSSGSIVSAATWGIGGFSGRNLNGSAVTKCFTSCSVQSKSSTNVNYLVGVIEDGATALKCYYSDSMVITVNAETYVPEKTNATAQNESDFCTETFICGTLTWDSETWSITGDSFPVLK